ALQLPEETTPPSAELRTMRQLLDRIATTQLDEPLAMYQTTSHHLAAFTGSVEEALEIQTVDETVDGFSFYLAKQHMPRNTVRSYRNYATRLLRLAKEFGWAPKPHPLDRV